MKAVLQRVYDASVSVDGKVVGAIDSGLLVYAGIGHEDGDFDLDWMARKIAGLRIFEDADGKMNLSVDEKGGAILLVSQFTLYADARKGRRPGFSAAALPDKAKPMVDALAERLRALGVTTEQGVFGADMKVRYVNDGPVTIILDSSEARG